MANRLFDVMTMIVVVGGVMVLVRPGSQGPSLVGALGNAFQGSLSVATGTGIPSNFKPLPAWG